MGSKNSLSKWIRFSLLAIFLILPDILRADDTAMGLLFRRGGGIFRRNFQGGGSCPNCPGPNRNAPDNHNIDEDGEDGDEGNEDDGEVAPNRIRPEPGPSDRGRYKPDLNEDDEDGDEDDEDEDDDDEDERARPKKKPNTKVDPNKGGKLAPDPKPAVLLPLYIPQHEMYGPLEGTAIPQKTTPMAPISIPAPVISTPQLTPVPTTVVPTPQLTPAPRPTSIPKVDKSHTDCCPDCKPKWQGNSVKRPSASESPNGGRPGPSDLTPAGVGGNPGFQVRIKEEGRQYGLCQMTMVDTCVAATANHCVEGRDVVEFQAADLGEKVKGIVYSHPKYSRTQNGGSDVLVNDVALVKLTGQACEHSKSLPIVPISTDAAEAGEKIRVGSGWLKRAFGGVARPVKKAVVSVELGKGGVRQGDSGGPLISGGVIKGFLSTAPRMLGRDGKPAFVTQGYYAGGSALQWAAKKAKELSETPSQSFSNQFTLLMENAL